MVCGYTQGTGHWEKTFGALVLGYYDEKDELEPAGSVGSGFDNDTLVTLRRPLDTKVIKNSPFNTKINDSIETTWVKPELVVEVKFAEWTKDRSLRAPVFLRVRDDKPAASVHPTKVIVIPPKSLKTTVVENTGSLKNLLD